MRRGGVDATSLHSWRRRVEWTDGASGIPVVFLESLSEGGTNISDSQSREGPSASAPPSVGKTLFEASGKRHKDVCGRLQEAAASAAAEEPDTANIRAGGATGTLTFKPPGEK